MATSGTTSDSSDTVSDNKWQRMTTCDNEWPFQLIFFFFFFRINKEPTTKYPKENSLNLREDLEEKLLN